MTGYRTVRRKPYCCGWRRCLTRSRSRLRHHPLNRQIPQSLHPPLDKPCRRRRSNRQALACRRTSCGHRDASEDRCPHRVVKGTATTQGSGRQRVVTAFSLRIELGQRANSSWASTAAMVRRSILPIRSRKFSVQRLTYSHTPCLKRTEQWYNSKRQMMGWKIAFTACDFAARRLTLSWLRHHSSRRLQQGCRPERLCPRYHTV